MKIAHIFAANSYLIAESYIEFIYENFQDDFHKVIVIGDDFDESINSFPKSDNEIQYFSSYKADLKEIVRLYNSFDKIIYHSLSLPVKTQLVFLINNNIMNKIYWVAWGYDLYQWKLVNDSLKNIIANVIFYTFRKKIKNFIGIFPPDIDYFNKTINSNANTFYANYVLGLYNPFYNKNDLVNTLEEKIRDKICINIQLGHSSTSILNHFDSLNMLKKFAKENIMIHIPLSYGDEKYGDKVEKYAKDLFGEKVICYRDLINREKYHDFLSCIDIAIFNTTRQIGIGNISPLLFMRKKVYFPKNSVMYVYFRKEGINVSNYNEIENITAEQFLSPVCMKLAKEYIIKTELNKDVKIRMWDSIFSTSEDKVYIDE